MVLLRNPITRRKSLTTADKARIAWHLIRGKKSEKVAEMFPAYSLKQIMDVAKQIREGKLPLLVKTLKERSIKLQKGKKQC
jgi:hypothetical protein